MKTEELVIKIKKGAVNLPDCSMKCEADQFIYKLLDMFNRKIEELLKEIETKTSELPECPNNCDSNKYILEIDVKIIKIKQKNELGGGE